MVALTFYFRLFTASAQWLGRITLNCFLLVLSMIHVHHVMMSMMIHVPSPFASYMYDIHGSEKAWDIRRLAIQLRVRNSKEWWCENSSSRS